MSREQGLPKLHARWDRDLPVLLTPAEVAAACARGRRDVPGRPELAEQRIFGTGGY